MSHFAGAAGAAGASAAFHSDESDDESASLTPSESDAFFDAGTGFQPQAGWAFSADSILCSLAGVDDHVLVLGGERVGKTSLITALTGKEDATPSLSHQRSTASGHWTEDSLVQVKFIKDDRTGRTTAYIELLGLLGMRGETRMLLRSLYEVLHHAVGPCKLLFIFTPDHSATPLYHRGAYLMRKVVELFFKAGLSSMATTYSVLFNKCDSDVMHLSQSSDGCAFLRRYWGCDTAHCAFFPMLGQQEDSTIFSSWLQSEDGMSQLETFFNAAPNVSLPNHDAFLSAVRELFPTEVAHDAWANGMASGKTVATCRWKEWAGDFFHETNARCSMLFLGTRGTGKSTLLRTLVGKQMEEDVGLMNGREGDDLGLRRWVDVKEDVAYFDTPGFAGRKDLSQVCAAVSQALRLAKGPTKLIFVCTLRDGCVDVEDLEFVRLVLGALESGNVDTMGRYSIVFNKTGIQELEFIKRTKDWGEQLAQLLQNDMLPSHMDINRDLLQRILPTHFGLVRFEKNVGMGEGSLSEEECAALKRFVDWAPVVRIPSIVGNWLEAQDFD